MGVTNKTGFGLDKFIDHCFKIIRNYNSYPCNRP
jgi:hypothetical protein